jgi:hypothetical protein
VHILPGNDIGKQEVVPENGSRGVIAGRFDPENVNGHIQCEIKHKSTIKKAFKILTCAIVVLFSLVITIYAVIRDPRFQTLGMRMTAAYFSREWKTEVRVGEFGFSITNGVFLKDVVVKDQRDSILFATHELAVQPDLKQLWNGYIHVRKVLIDGGEFQLLTHKGDSTLNLQFIIDYFASADTTPKPPDTTGKPLSISGRLIVIRNFRFHLQDYNAVPVTDGMDYANLDIREISLHISNFSVAGDTISANITSLTAKERCGFDLQSFSGEASVCSHFVKVRNLKILTPRSDLDLDFAMLYDGYAGFLDFLNKVTLKGDIRPSTFNLADVGCFAPELKVMDDPMRIQGNMEGTVSRFHGKNLKFALGEGTMFSGDVMAAGLPDVYRTYVDLEIRNLTSNKRDIERFRLPTEPDSIALPEVLAVLGTFTVDGRFTGFWDDFTASFSAATEVGNVSGNLEFRKVQDAKTFAYNGQVSATSLNAGLLLGAEKLVGRTTFHGAINGQGLDLDKADVTFNIAVDSLRLNGYDYRRIAVNGSLAKKEFDGLLSFRDPNVWLDVNGVADLHDSLPSFDFNALIHHAQLFNLNLLKRDSAENISGEILARFTGNTIDNITGMFRLDEFSYTEGKHTANLSKLLLKTSKDMRGDKSLRLESDFLNADVTGVFSFSNLIGAFDLFIRNYLASFNLKDSLRVANHSAPQLMRFILEFGETKPVTDIFLPFLSISKGTTFNGFFDTEQEIIRLEGSSSHLNIFGRDISDWTLEAESSTTELKVTTGCRSFFISRSGSSDTLDLRLDSLLVRSFFRRDSILYNIGWNSRGGHSILDGTAAFPDDGSVTFNLSRFDVMIKNNLWHIAPDNLLVIDSSGIAFRNFSFFAANQALSAGGKISENPTDTLGLNFKNIDISDLDHFIGSKNINVDGILSGKLKLRNIYKDLALYSDLRLDKLKFNGESLGDALIAVDYDNAHERFDIDAKVIYTGNIGQNIPISIKGSYIMGEKPAFDFNVGLKNLNLKMVQPFISDVMSRVTGLVSGDAHFYGTPDNPEMTGQLKLMRTEFAIGYLNVPYSLSDVVNIEPGKLVFDNITLYDSLGNKAFVNGSITHNHFKDFRLNLDVSMEDFCAFKNTLAQNSTFYGNARAKGTVQVTGPIDNIMITVRANTGSNTHVVIPINLTADVGDINYIIFDNPSDTTVMFPATAVPVSVSGISLNINLAVNPDAAVEVFLPDQLGNLKASGKGNLTMAMTPTTPFTLNGSYVISKGSFLLQLRNLLRLPFIISEGSRIAWTGDPADADINLSAIYRTKVPLSGLTTDPELASTRVPVECILRLKGKLLNPVYEFGLNMPNVEESLKNLVFNAIDTNNQILMSQQVLSILMLNQFSPIVGTSADFSVSGTSMSIVTNQINSMISRMTNRVSVDVNYKPASSTVGQEFDVGLSTQFLDDRLLIDGAFGMTSYKNATSQQTNTIVGDINIEYVLTKNRRWRVRAFNRTNTLDLLYNNSPYTQGVGISYQRDFSSFRDLFKPVKSEK